MENVDEFEKWLARVIKDSKEVLFMTDTTIAYILLREGTNYYFRSLGKSSAPAPAKEGSRPS